MQNIIIRGVFTGEVKEARASAWSWPSTLVTAFMFSHSLNHAGASAFKVKADRQSLVKEEAK